MMKSKSNLAFSDKNIFRAFIYANDPGTSYIVTDTLWLVQKSHAVIDY